MSRLDCTGARAVARVRGLAYRSYYRLARENYERELFARRNHTPAGSFRCYEPCNRHGEDEMLAELDEWCSDADAIYDIGANVGIYALALATDSRRQLVAIEPSPQVVKQLRTNVRCNNDLEERIEVYACGIGDDDGDRPFYVSTHAELSAFDRESARRWEADVADVRTVPVRRLDTLVFDHQLPAPDACKIDVEGAAPAVIRGARETLERDGPTLFVEPHDEGLSADVSGELGTELEACGYVIHEREGYWRCEPA